jgi:hypothetical protein
MDELFLEATNYQIVSTTEAMISTCHNSACGAFGGVRVWVTHLDAGVFRPNVQTLIIPYVRFFAAFVLFCFHYSHVTSLFSPISYLYGQPGF